MEGPVIIAPVPRECSVIANADEQKFEDSEAVAVVPGAWHVGRNAAGQGLIVGSLEKSHGNSVNSSWAEAGTVTRR